MIELPDDIATSSATFTPVDLGFVQEGATGIGDRIDRPGNHFSCEVDFPPMKPAQAGAFAVRIARAMRQGLRVKIPLLGLSQGNPGEPVVDGDEPSGTSLPLRGLTPGYVAKEGYWLTITEAATEQRYTHKVAATGKVGADGTLDLDIEPPLRAPFADGDTVNLAKPTIEGLLKGVASWMLSTDRLIRNGARLTIEEQAGAGVMPSPTFDAGSITWDMG